MVPLPIDARLPELGRILAAHRNAVVTAPPGTGKTTRVPLFLLSETWLEGRKILLLEPRRLAARAAAGHMSFLLQEPVGKTVGFRIRLERKITASTRIEVVTEGILTRMIQNDPELTGIGLVIFDEFHERSIHADTGLAFCLDCQEGLRPDLRLLVMSATLDAEAVSGILGNAPVLSAAAKQYPVDTRYLLCPPNQSPVASVPAAILQALRNDTGSMLVFLPGIREIRQVMERLAQSGLDTSTIVAPLYGGLPGTSQDLAIEPAPAGRRKIVLATSIAETSLTIEGVRIVIDSGLMRVSRYDAGSGMSRLVTIPVTRDTADQRRGRAGRLEPGVCYRLWSEERHRLLTEHNSPEILSTDLTPLALELAVWGVSDPAGLKWLDLPPEGTFHQAAALLNRLGALDDSGRITGHGRRLSELGMHPRLGHMICRAEGPGCGDLACELAALLGERDILHLPPDQRDADLRIRVAELRAAGSDRSHPGRTAISAAVDSAACRRVRKTADVLKSQIHDSGSRTPLDLCGLVLAFAYPDRVACRRPGDSFRYRMSGGRGAYFADAEPLSAEACLVVATTDGEPQDARIFLAAPVSPETLMEYFPDQVTEESAVYWDHRNRMVKARRELRFGKAILKEGPLPDPDTDRIARALCEGIRQEGPQLLPWTGQARSFQARVLLLRRLDPSGTEWPDVSDTALLQTLETWLLPYLTGIVKAEHLGRIDLAGALTAVLSWKQRQDLDRLAPTHVTVPSGSRIPVDYTAGETPVLAVRLQEMFGATETPAIAGGRLPLLIHLLSPAGRPVQVTGDLKSFWTGAYFEVKKDLMGRYPKHHWPDDPLTAPATNRTKKRK